MMKFEDLKQGTPRLVVQHGRNAAGNHTFQWGVVGMIPIMWLVGIICRVQAELPLLEPGDERHRCPQDALCIAWDEEEQRAEWFVHPGIPTDPLVGMLEMVKTVMVGTQLARQQANQQLILGPDGRPVRG